MGDNTQKQDEIDGLTARLTGSSVAETEPTPSSSSNSTEKKWSPGSGTTSTVKDPPPTSGGKRRISGNWRGRVSNTTYHNRASSTDNWRAKAPATAPTSKAASFNRASLSVWWRANPKSTDTDSPTQQLGEEPSANETKASGTESQLKVVGEDEEQEGRKEAATAA